jgi:hypothetical protein
MAYDWEGRRTRRLQMLRVAAAVLLSAALVALPLLIAGWKINL